MLVPLNAEYIKVRIMYDFNTDRPTFFDAYQVIHNGVVQGYCDDNGEVAKLPDVHEAVVINTTTLPKKPASFLPLVDDGIEDPNKVEPEVEPNSTPEPTQAPEGTPLNE